MAQLKDNPAPPAGRRSNARSYAERHGLLAMKIGDTRFLPRETSASFNFHSHYFRCRGRDFATRARFEDGKAGLRVWRLA